MSPKFMAAASLSTSAKRKAMLSSNDLKRRSKRPHNARIAFQRAKYVFKPPHVLTTASFCLLALHLSSEMPDILQRCSLKSASVIGADICLELEQCLFYDLSSGTRHVRRSSAV